MIDLIPTKKATVSFAMVLILSLLFLLVMFAFIKETGQRSEQAIDEATDIASTLDFFDINLDLETTAIRKNAIDQLPPSLVNYINSIIYQIFDPTYVRTTGTSTYSNSNKNLRYFDYFEIDKYTIRFEDDGVGIRVYVYTGLNNIYEFVTYENLPFLKNKQLAIIESGKIYDPTVKCYTEITEHYCIANFVYGDDCKDEDYASFEAFAFTWFLTRYYQVPLNPFLKESANHEIPSGETADRISKLWAIWAGTNPKSENGCYYLKNTKDYLLRNYQDVNDYMLPVKSIEITQKKDTDHTYSEIAWKLFDNTRGYSTLGTRDLSAQDPKRKIYGFGHLVLQLTEEDSKTLKNGRPISNRNFYVFFPTVKAPAATGNRVVDPDQAVGVDFIGNKIVFDGIGFLEVRSVDNIIKNINKFK
jgi:hypothetical protein